MDMKMYDATSVIGESVEYMRNYCLIITWRQFSYVSDHIVLARIPQLPAYCGRKSYCNIQEIFCYFVNLNLCMVSVEPGLFLVALCFFFPTFVGKQKNKNNEWNLRFYIYMYMNSGVHHDVLYTTLPAEFVFTLRSCSLLSLYKCLICLTVTLSDLCRYICSLYHGFCRLVDKAQLLVNLS